MFSLSTEYNYKHIKHLVLFKKYNININSNSIYLFIKIKIIVRSLILYIQITLNRWNGKSTCKSSTEIDTALTGLSLRLGISDYYSFNHKIWDIHIY